TEVRTVIKHVTKRLREHWRKTRVVWRGDSHYGRVEAMEWAENNDADYIFGLAGNAALDAIVAEVAVNLRFHHAMSSKARLRTFARAPDQDRRARDRTHRAHPRPTADELPGRGVVPGRRTRPEAVRPMSRGAACPDEPPTEAIQHQTRCTASGFTPIPSIGL